MKKLLSFTVILIGLLLFLPSKSYASHMAGGEITWVCLPNGQYVFKMDVYRECTGTSFFFNSQTISYQSGSITVKPDSNRWLRYGAGNISPKGPNGCQRQCDQPGADIGATQFFPFISDPVTLTGTPPPGGWLFTWTLCCRPSSVANLTTPASRSFTLRARMYPYRENGVNAEPANPCYDSSPKFEELPAVLICKGYDFIYNHNASDHDLDSLVYRWAFPWDTKNNPVDFAPGYAYNSPMPGPSAHPLNKTAQLNTQTGEIRFGAYSGQSGQQYATCIQVDAYRCGQKIASIFRDIPFILFDCPPLPGTGFVNNPPTAMVNGVPAIGYVDTVYAGEKISLPFQSVENDVIYADPADPTTARLQQNYLSPSGFLFSNDFQDPNNCKTSTVAPCATLTPPPMRNPLNDQMELSNQGTVSSLFEWQTTCAHLNADLGCTSTGGTYNFVMKTYDDHCDVPGIIYPSISIHVLAPPIVDHPEIRGASVELDGTVTLHYKKPPPPNSTLEKYELHYGLGDANSYPSLMTPMLGYDNIINFNGPLNLNYPFVDYLNYRWTQEPLDYNYLSIRSFSGCGGNQPSEFSDTIRIPRAMVEPAGPAGAVKSKAKVTWDFLRNPASERLPSASNVFRIWANYPVYTAQDIMDSSNWKLLGSTTNYEYIVEEALTCNEPIAFRVELMDSLKTDSIISFFTSIDTMSMAPKNDPPSPLIDSVSVDMNGNVYIGITPGRPVSKHEIYDVTNGSPGVLVGTIYGETLDTLLPGVNADQGIKKYYVKAFDLCYPGLTGSSVEHNTIFIDPNQAVLLNACAGNYQIGWNAYNGWPTQNNTVVYDVLYSTNGPMGPYKLAGSTTGTTFIHTNIKGATSYVYKIYAHDDMGHHSTSALFNVYQKAKPSPEVVPAPLILCARVQQPSGNVELDWSNPVDSTMNSLYYEFQYRLNGGNWQSVTVNNTNLTTYPFNVDGNAGIVEFRARTFSDSCNTPTPSAFSEIFSTIFVKPEYQLTSGGDTIYNAGNVSWNSIPLDTVNPYVLGRNFTSESTFNMMYRGSQNFIPDPGAAYCDVWIKYRVTIMDTSGCMNISSVDSINYKDNEIPNMQPIDYISYVRNTGELLVKWSVKPLNSNDVDSVSLVVPDPNDPNLFEEIVTVPWTDREIRVLHPSTDASFDVRTVALQAIDACNKESKEFDFHSTIDVDANWDTCAKTFSLNWNGYENFRTPGEVVYTVYYSDDNINFIPLSPNGTTMDTVFTGTIPDFKESHGYYFYIEARDQDGNGNYISNSNVDSILTLVEAMPDFTYLRTATVNTPSQVQVDGFVDDSVAVARYNIYRGVYSDQMFKVGAVPPSEVDNRNFSYLDNSADAAASSYFYYIQVESPCGNFLDTSNFGRSIHLTVEADHERVANVLKWNAYEGWDSSVSYYNIYRGVDGVFDFMNVYAEVEPVNDGEQTFVDNVIDESYALGSYCYAVEAIEGPVKPELASFITSATSKSNYACADMEPLFYIPNAFSPSGLNKVFRPEGQFVNYQFYELVIYNRWGEKVFETRDFFEGWDGTMNGEPAQDGTYVYTIRFKGADGKEHSKKGTVTLIR